MSRSEYFAALCVLGCINGIGSRAIQAIASYGLVEATFSTFDVSALVWIAGAIAVGLHAIKRIENPGERLLGNPRSVIPHAN